MMIEDEVNERYRHLLQPLRDISANWKLSIQEYLDDYLEKLHADRERNRINADGEVIKFNFAEAAALIQGSLRIFAQKVDWLHEAISEAYLGISNNARKKKKKNVGDPNEGAAGFTGRLNTDFQFVDEKHKMLNHMVNTKWLLQHERKHEPKVPVRVGQRREAGRRDRFVDLPISFIPTKKSAPSAHHFYYRQNNEDIYVPQSDMCSYNSIAFASNDGSDMTIFINSAYLELVHTFSAEYIPYLRDDRGQRLQRLAVPYEHQVAPSEVYQRLLELDQRETRGNEPQEFFDCFDGEGVDDGSADAADVVDLTVDLETQEMIRSSPVVVPRNSIPTTNGGISLELEAPTTQGSQNVTVVDKPESNKSYRHENVFEPVPAEPWVDVDEELAFIDEYVDVRSRLRKKPDEKDKKKPKRHVRAAELCQARDEAIRMKFEEAGKNYEMYKKNLSEYITAKMFSRRLCTVGSALENLNPSLRSVHVQALNRVFYAHEKYEKAIRTQRQQERKEAERAKRKKEREKRKREQAQQLRSPQIKRRRLTDEGPATIGDAQGDEEVRHGAFAVPPVLNQDQVHQKGEELEENDENDLDYFGVQPDDDDVVQMEIDGQEDDIEGQYNPIALMDREIQMLINRENLTDDEEDEEIGREVNIFATEEFANEPQTQDVVLGDNANFMLNEVQSNFELGTFATNDPSFFDLDKLAEVFSCANFELITDDQILLHSIQNFWSVTNKDLKAGSKQRLQQWSSRILERVDEDTRHKSFEIHEYGTAILNAFGENGIGRTIKFKKIVKGVPKYEISRYLLAALILANCGNIEIMGQNAEAASRGMKIDGKFTLKLLSLQRHHEVFASEQLLITS